MNGSAFTNKERQNLIAIPTLIADGMMRSIVRNFSRMFHAPPSFVRSQFFLDWVSEVWSEQQK
jgi:hypothetical protein